jgi:hypothetical protein
VRQRRREIGADGKDLDIQVIELSDTRLVRRDLLRSTTGEGGREEGQDYRLFPAEIGQLYWLAFRVRKREIGRLIANFEIGLGRLDILRRG